MKKKLAVVALVVLVAAMSVLGTAAYFTGKDTVENTFTNGKVAITLDEAKVDENGVPTEPAERVKSNEYKLMPGMTYTKDPTVTVKAGSAESYVRLKVTVNNARALIAMCTDPEYADIETGIEKAFPLVRIFNFGLISSMYWESPIHPDHGTLSMERYIDDPRYCVYDETADTLTYYFYYFETVAAPNADVKLPTLFDSVKIPDWVTYEQAEALNNFKITVVAEAIQAATFENADAAWAAFSAQGN